MLTVGLSEFCSSPNWLAGRRRRSSSLSPYVSFPTVSCIVCFLDFLFFSPRLHSPSNHQPETKPFSPRWECTSTDMAGGSRRSLTETEGRDPCRTAFERPLLWPPHPPSPSSQNAKAAASLPPPPQCFVENVSYRSGRVKSKAGWLFCKCHLVKTHSRTVFFLLVRPSLSSAAVWWNFFKEEQWRDIPMKLGLLKANCRLRSVSTPDRAFNVNKSHLHKMLFS